MSRIKILAETARTVTLYRKDYDALLQAADHPVDRAAVEAHRADEAKVGWNVARRNYFSRDEAERLLDGESPVRIWREKRGMTQRALADATEIGPSYLAEIEGGKKPGSAVALRRIAQILGVPMEQLVEPAERKKRKARKPILRFGGAADGS
jgi:ribosome-binding protein aMBF1 (putative translation factor)